MKTSKKIHFVLLIGLLGLSSCKRKTAPAPAKEAATQEHRSFAFSPKADGPLDERIKGLPSSTAGLIALLQSPDPSLSSQGIETALDYLKRPKPAENSANPAAEYFNNVIAILLAQKGQVEGFTEGLISVVNNQSLPLLLQNYALQHYYHAWLRELDPTLREKLEKQLKGFYENPTHPLQAVAILTTSRLIDQEDDLRGPNGETLRPIGEAARPSGLYQGKPLSFDRESFSQAALRTIQDDQSMAEAKVSALNVLIQLRDHRSLPLAREIVDAAHQPDSVLSTALATIGTFGNLHEDHSRLQSVPVIPATVRAAAKSAIKQLKKNNSSH